MLSVAAAHGLDELIVTPLRSKFRLVSSYFAASLALLPFQKNWEWLDGNAKVPLVVGSRCSMFTDRNDGKPTIAKEVQEETAALLPTLRSLGGRAAPIDLSECGRAH